MRGSLTRLTHEDDTIPSSIQGRTRTHAHRRGLVRYSHQRLAPHAVTTHKCCAHELPSAVYASSSIKHSLITASLSHPIPSLSFSLTHLFTPLALLGGPPWTPPISARAQVQYIPDIGTEFGRRTVWSQVPVTRPARRSSIPLRAVLAPPYVRD